MELKLWIMYINKVKISWKMNVFFIIYLCLFMNFYVFCFLFNLFICVCVFKCRLLF